ncbi:MAG: Ig-like domain-containing protein [Alphaproteobacteria bacterium]|nr:Ig-like domain-containing protein [Alphaproteobacteria bacterium]
MLISLTISSASALGTTEPCDVPVLSTTLPADGDVGVLPDAVITLVFHASGGACAPATFGGTLTRASDGVEVPFGTMSDAAGLVVTIVPEEPLEVGQTYEVAAEVFEFVVRFEVGEEGLPMTAEPSDLSIEATASCDPLELTMLREVVTFDALGRGLLQTRLARDGAFGDWTTRAALGDDTTYILTDTLLGSGGEHCFGVRLLDETGEVVWTVDDAGCASTDACPPPEEESRGCSTAGGAGGSVLPLLLLAFRRRRTRC